MEEEIILNNNEEKLVDEATAAIDNVTEVDGVDVPAADGVEDELASMFAADVDSIKNDSTISENLEGFAQGFPDWDLHPPKM